MVLVVTKDKCNGSITYCDINSYFIFSVNCNSDLLLASFLLSLTLYMAAVYSSVNPRLIPEWPGSKKLSKTCSLL